MEYSIELVDEGGRKVRVNISGHWSALNAEVAERILDRVGFSLSDYEATPSEPPAGAVLYAAPDSEFADEAARYAEAARYEDDWLEAAYEERFEEPPGFDEQYDREVEL